MTIGFNQAFGGSGGGTSLGAWAVPVLSSKTFPPMSRDAQVQIAVVAATGSGGGKTDGAITYTSGANSSPIGVKVLDIAAGDVVSFEMGACGLPQTAQTAGLPGNNTLVKVNGVVVMTAQPGEPGAFNALPPVPTATVIGADRVVPGIRAGAGLQYTGGGGAAVNVFSTGRGTNAGSPGGSVGVDTSGGPIPFTSTELGVAFLGLNTPGMAGVGGEPGFPGGAFAGGGGGTRGGKGGYGAGGGGGSNGSPSGAGGDAYAYMIVVPKE